MPKRSGVAVLTDSVSPGFYFPLWHNYYARQFGAENIFLVTYEKTKKAFHDFELGGIWQADQYNNDERIVLISQMASVLLESYEFVVRVDTDEFLVPDVRHHSSLRDFVGCMRKPYVTAEGLDIIPLPDESALDLTRSVIGAQRNSGYFYNALYKTCITSIPIRWAPGFHFCSVFPEFNGLYLFHLKRADLDIQMAIGREISAKAQGERNQPYYLTPKEQLMAHNKGALGFEAVSGWESFDRKSYRAAFIQEMHFSTRFGGVYHGGEFRPDKALVTLPEEFAGVL